jgi:hypothetical protein
MTVSLSSATAEVSQASTYHQFRQDRIARNRDLDRLERRDPARWLNVIQPALVATARTALDQASDDQARQWWRDELAHLETGVPADEAAKARIHYLERQRKRREAFAPFLADPPEPIDEAEDARIRAKNAEPRPKRLKPIYKTIRGERVRIYRKGELS